MWWYDLWPVDIYQMLVALHVADIGVSVIIVGILYMIWRSEE